MESIVIEGTKYQKASSVARDFGYTTDYIGQLCRSGKVDSQLVGRSWFVDPTSLKSHKQTRYRSSLKKTKAALHEVVEADDTESDTAQTVKVKKYKAGFYSRAASPSITIHYEHDDEALLPETKAEHKRAALPVRLAGAEKVEIKESDPTYKLEPSKIPKIRFKGKLDIASAEDTAAPSDPDEASTQPADADKAKPIDKKAKVKADTELVKEAKPKSTQSDEPKKTSTKSSVLITKEPGTSTHSPNTDFDPVHIAVRRVLDRPSIAGQLLWGGLVAVFVLTLGSLTLLSETVVVFSSQSVSSAVQFSPENFLNSLK